jgi:hypothetical protein
VNNTGFLVTMEIPLGNPVSIPVDYAIVLYEEP